MKTTTTILAIFFATSFAFAQSRSIVRADIRYVNLDLETDGRVECGSFDRAFASCAFFSLTDSTHLAFLERALRGVRPDTATDCSLDVRAKVVILWKKGTVNTLCVSRSGVCANSHPLSKCDRLLQFLEHTIKRHERASRH